MVDQAIIEVVHQTLVEEFELSAADLSAAVSLYEDLGLDSLDSVDLVVALERAVGFKIDRVADEERIRQVRTLEDLYGFVQAKVNSSGKQA
ncbi:MAG: acyl carrier protein [Phycisphaerales bacterium]|nr:MAG: acyl carrier protein [Phycisphaerales bacterium]